MYDGTMRRKAVNLLTVPDKTLPPQPLADEMLDQEREDAALVESADYALVAQAIR